MEDKYLKSINLDALNIAKKELVKLLERYQKKAEKEREKLSDIYVLVCGEKCRSDDDIMELYVADLISCNQADRYSEKLEKKKKQCGEVNGKTKCETVCQIITNFISQLDCEINELQSKSNLLD